MSKSPFIAPGGVVRYTLPGSDHWIEVKQRLTFGEKQRLEGGSLVGVVNDKGQTQMQIDWERFPVMRMAVWIVDWSFRDERDKSVKVTRSAIEALDPEMAVIILDMLDEHEQNIEAEKKANAPALSVVQP